MIPLYSDADGVLLDLCSSFHHFMADAHGFTAAVNEPADFGFNEAYPSLQDVTPYVIEFLRNYDYFSQMKAYPEALDAVKALHAIGSPITIITACGTDNSTRRARLDTIDREFGAYIKDAHILPLGHTKEEILRKLPKGGFVDDQLHVCEAAVVHTPHDVLLRNRRYNEEATHPMLDSKQITRFSQWSSLPIPGLKQALAAQVTPPEPTSDIQPESRPKP